MTRTDHNAKRIRYCVPFCRYGIGTAASGGAPVTAGGSGALTVTGAAGTYQQAMAIGQPGSFIGNATYPLSTGYVATFSGLSKQLVYEGDIYTRFRHNRLRFIAVPSTATTASARSYWMGWVDDPAIATRAATDTSAAALALSDIINLPNVKLFPAWTTTALECSVNREWKYNQQYVANGSSVTSAIYLTSLVRQMSPGALVMAADYTNASGIPLLDGIIWMEGELDVCDPFIDFVQPASLEAKAHDLDIEECHIPYRHRGPVATAQRAGAAPILKLVKPVTPPSSPRLISVEERGVDTSPRSFERV